MFVSLVIFGSHKRLLHKPFAGVLVISRRGRESNIIIMLSLGRAGEEPSHTTSPWFSQAPQQETVAHRRSAVCSFLYLGWSESVPQNAEGSPLTSDVGNSCQLIVKEALCSLSLRLLI